MVTDVDIVGSWRFEDAAKEVDLEIASDYTYQIVSRSRKFESFDQITDQSMMMIALSKSQSGTWEIKKSSNSFNLISKDRIQFEFAVGELATDRIVCRLGKNEIVELQRKRD